MNADQVAALSALLGPGGWMDQTQEFAHALLVSTRTPGGLLLVGAPDDEPWHLTAHLQDESQLAGIPELAPTLVRWSPQPDAPPHLRVGLARLAAASRGETLLVVSGQAAPARLLERVSDARRTGATILALDQDDPELDGLAHESLIVSAAPAAVSFDAAQHLVSSAAGGQRGGQRGRPALRRRLARLLDALSGTAPAD